MIKVFVLHRAVHNLNDMINVFKLQSIDVSNIIYTSDNPDILIATEWIYNCNDIKRMFLHMYNVSKLNIMWCGEAIHPDFNLFDYAISYSDLYENNIRHIRMMSPFMQWKDDFNIDYINTNIISNKTYFCNFIYSNAFGFDKRKHLYDLISSYKQVHSIGRFLNNNHITHWNGNMMSNTIDIKKDFKFSIAAENASFSGYTSEKIFTSLFAHTIPIYVGNPHICMDVNPKCFINTNNMTDDEIIETIKYYDNNETAFNNMLSENIQNKKQIEYYKKRDADYLLFFKNLFNGNISKTLDYGFHEENYILSNIYNKFRL